MEPRGKMGMDGEGGGGRGDVCELGCYGSGLVRVANLDVDGGCSGEVGNDNSRVLVPEMMVPPISSSSCATIHLPTLRFTSNTNSRP